MSPEGQRGAERGHKSQGRAELVPPNSPQRSATSGLCEEGARGPLSLPKLEPTYPGGWPGRRPPDRAAGPGVAGERRLHAGPACWLFLLPAGARERRQLWPCLSVPRRRAVSGWGPLAGGAGEECVARARREAGVGGCRRGRQSRPGAAQSWCACCRAGRPPPGALWPDRPRGGGGPRPGRPPWLGSSFAGKSRGGRSGEPGRRRRRRECGDAQEPRTDLVLGWACRQPRTARGLRSGEERVSRRGLVSK